MNQDADQTKERDCGLALQAGGDDSRRENAAREKRIYVILNPDIEWKKLGWCFALGGFVFCVIFAVTVNLFIRWVM